MARPIRVEYEGAFYHVIQRGIEKKPIFKLDSDKEKFLNYISTAYTRYGIICHCYAIMDNHYHLIIETPEANLTKVMHYLGASYAMYYNKTRQRVGPVYQGRYRAIIIQAEEYLHYLSRYVHLNSLKAKLINVAEEYKWSSYSYYIKKQNKPEWLETKYILSMFDIKEEKAKKGYKEFIERVDIEEKRIIKNNLHNGFVVGDGDFYEDIKTKYIVNREDYEIPVIREIKKKSELTMKNIGKIVRKEVGREGKIARKVSIYLSRKLTSNSLKEIAEEHGGIGYTGVSQLCKRMENKRKEDKSLDKLLKNIEKMCNVKT